MLITIYILTKHTIRIELAINVILWLLWGQSSIILTVSSFSNFPFNFKHASILWKDIICNKVYNQENSYVINFTISRTYLYLLLSVQPLNITWLVHVYLSTVHYRVHGSRHPPFVSILHTLKLNPLFCKLCPWESPSKHPSKYEKSVVFYNHYKGSLSCWTLVVVMDRYDLTCDTQFTCRKQSSGGPWFMVLHADHPSDDI